MCCAVMQSGPWGHHIIGRVVGLSIAREAARTVAHLTLGRKAGDAREHRANTYCTRYTHVCTQEKTKALCGPPVTSLAARTHSYRQTTLRRTDAGPPCVKRN